MRLVEIEYIDGRLIFLRPCSRSRLSALEVMLKKLYERWLEYQLSAEEVILDQGCWQLMLDIAALFPQLNRPGCFGFDLREIVRLVDRFDDEGDRTTVVEGDIEQIEALFLAQREAGKYKACKLADLVYFEPLPAPQWQTTKEDAPPPIPSSGDPEMDLLANLSAAFDWNQAHSIYDSLDAEALDRYLHQINEHRRDPEERKMEDLAQDYAAWKAENNDTFRETLGIKFKRPVEAES